MSAPLLGTGVVKKARGWWLYVVQDGKRITGDLWGPYPTELAARQQGMALREHYARVLGTSLGEDGQPR